MLTAEQRRAMTELNDDYRSRICAELGLPASVDSRAWALLGELIEHAVFVGKWGHRANATATVSAPAVQP